ncbi:MAG: hypothetical protein ACJ75H_07695 [Thermoanaerobaculia bacterium]
MKKACTLAAAALVLAAAASYADEAPRQVRDREAGDFVSRLAEKSYTLVVDPEGAATPGAEALHYLVTRESAKQHIIYAFSSPEGREKFVTRHASAIEGNRAGLTENTCVNARFNKVAYGTGIDWLQMYCGQTNGFLSDAWNDVISYVEASGSWTFLYKCYNFNRAPYYNTGCTTLTMQGGAVIQDLNTVNFNNITSSIKVCPEGITFTECQNYF